MKKINRLFVNEVYMIGETKGWQQVNKYMTIKDINKMFKSGKVITVNVMENKEEFIGSDFNYNTFREEYPTLETYFERLVDEAKDRIRFGQGIELPQDMKINLSSLVSKSYEGIYYTETKEIDMRMSYIREGFNDYGTYCGKVMEEKIIAVIIHEIGHLMHDLINGMNDLKLPQENKSGYARKNHMEDFAEAFRDLVMQDRNAYKRDRAMINILSTR